MDIPRYETALIVGAGAGLSASLARLFAREGIRTAMAARNPAKLEALCRDTGQGQRPGFPRHLHPTRQDHLDHFRTQGKQTGATALWLKQRCAPS
jgi:NADP-dependent 3-hydroxy acid dehydrogenase YdfG